jgi:hypothetical protein
MKRTLALQALALGAYLFGGASSSRAADGVPPAVARVQLEYRREASAATCISPEQLRSGVEARLDRSVFAAAAQAELRARVLARRSAGRYVIEIALFDREGHSLGARQLTTSAPHCSSLDDSVTLVLSLAVDVARPPIGDDALERELVPPARGAPAPAPASPPAESLGTPLAIPATTPAPRRGLRLEPTLGVALITGLLARPAYGLELGVTLRANAFWPVSLRGTGWAGQRHELEGGVRGATFSVQTLEVGVCPWTAELGGSSVSLCALEWLGLGRARGFGFDESERSAAWLVQFGLGATFSHPLGPLFVSASGSALVPAIRRRYYFTEGATDAADITLYEQPWLSLGAALRIGLEL